jgi:glycosyltransferase involved in cell wall biosynthesis
MTAVGAVSNSEVPRLLSACDVGVLPATNDYGQPMKLLDYAAAALPSVAPDVPPVRELVRDGFSGLLFRSGDPGALQSALARLVADPELRQHMGGRARAHALGGMSWSDRARALVSCIQRLSAAATKEDRRDDFATDLKFACERRLS